mgnify:CR=1 FL=1
MLKVECGYKPCQCTLLDDEGVTVNEVRYCSDGCAEGEGCTCTNCNCAEEIRQEVTPPQAGM